MALTSKTGLIPSPTKKLDRISKGKKIFLRAFVCPAPYTLKPYAGLYNPFPRSCSLLCNHPADNEARELLRKAKDTWALDGKSVLLVDEVAAIKAELEKMHAANCQSIEHSNNAPPAEMVPEELFRRYTDTDSRPLTPAPTLASVHTRTSGSRRCVTPDPMPTVQIKEKTLLILDLRRSHSQETLSWCGYSQYGQQEPPLIKVYKAPTRTAESFTQNSLETAKNTHDKFRHICTVPKSIKNGHNLEITPPISSKAQIEPYDGEEEVVRRRGRKKKKKGRDSSKGPPAIQSSIDPETQVAAVGGVSQNPSARPSLVPNHDLPLKDLVTKKSALKNHTSLDIDSYLDFEILKKLRRELTAEIIDNEFNPRMHKALEEAMKTVRLDKPVCEELHLLKRELSITPLNADMWLSLPRVFTRSSATFELPMDSRALSSLVPLQYVKDYINITSSRKLLYNCIFNKFKEENGHQRILCGNNLLTALGQMMGKELNEKQVSKIQYLLGWKDDDLIDYKTFCGICALCERLLAPEFCLQMPSRKVDPCHEIETVDFELLDRKLEDQTPDERLVEILNSIKFL